MEPGTVENFVALENELPQHSLNRARIGMR
jgi:hypothetical protein